MKLRDLEVGARFTITGGRPTVYEARGNGWFSTPAGYDGGPWWEPDAEVRREDEPRGFELRVAEPGWAMRCPTCGFEARAGGLGACLGAVEAHACGGEDPAAERAERLRVASLRAVGCPDHLRGVDGLCPMCGDPVPDA